MNFFSCIEKKEPSFLIFQKNRPKKNLQGSVAWHIIIRVLQKNCSFRISIREKNGRVLFILF